MTRHQFVEPPTPHPCIAHHAKDPDRPRTASRGLLCEGHYLGLEQRLAELPALIDEVQQALVRFGNGLNPKVTGTSTHPLPYLTDHDGNSRAADALRDVHARMVSWTLLVLEEHPSGPHSPADTPPALSAFLICHLDWLTGHDLIGELCRETSEDRSQLLAARTVSRTKVVTLGTCDERLGVCDVESHVEVWSCCEGTLRAFVAPDDTDPRPIVCSACGTEHQPETWRPLARRLRKDAAPMLTYAQLSQTLRVPIGTLKRWAMEDDWRRLEGRPSRYHHDDAQSSFDNHHRLEETA